MFDVSAIGKEMLLYAFGGWNEWLGIFLMSIGMNGLAGIAVLFKENQAFDLHKGIGAASQKVLILLMFMFAHRLDVVMEAQFIMTGTISFYLAREVLSIAENYGRIGLPLPSPVKRALQMMRSKGGGLK